MWEYLQGINMLIGLIITVFSGLGGLIYWIHRRIRAVSTDVILREEPTRREMLSRMTSLEGDHKGFRRDMHQLGSRMANVERSIETVARQEDLMPIQSELSQMRGSMDALNRGMDTLYKAALRAGEKKGD
ncbi:hypothetical protein [Thalassococcus sp. S3]|uniref:hypothetical protein n=1 Tax=Thalassococcus sp. S3 TaxID=2017482 RepID=UPI0010247789|nr:hypothetical protein [Thalassococcus sp. S3]QBF31514.1 hypothetical protein CFI11_09835 [Thalassococcus sp. S3]